MTTHSLAPDCDACTTCLGCGLSWCRDETPSPGEGEGQGGGAMTPAIAATFALAAALLLAGVALKRADQRASRFVERTHVPLHQEDR